MKIPARHLVPFFSVFVLAIASNTLALPARAAAPPLRAAASYGALPLSFEANEGQADPAIQFLTRGHGYTLLLRPDRALLVLNAPRSGATAAHPQLPQPAALVEMRLQGANPHAQPSPDDPQVTRTNYLIGNDPTRWLTNLHNYGRVRYHAIYPGIDLVYYGNQRRLEHDFILAPHADPAQIRLTFAGAQAGARSVAVDPRTGDLLLRTAQGDVRLLKPISYQQSNGRRTEIPTRYQLLAHHQVRFVLDRYDHSQPLIIDPVLVYSTYLGGSGPNAGYSGVDEGLGITVDASGNAYIVGDTQSADFPVTSGVYQPTNRAVANAPQRTAFVSKLNSTGTQLLFSTYLGGTDNGPQNDSTSGDHAVSVALDSSQNVYVTGYTDTNDFPTTSGAYQSVNYHGQPGDSRGSSTFIAKLNATGTQLLYSTLLGGHAPLYSHWSDKAVAIAVDSANHAFVAGTTQSTDFPTTAGAFQTTVSSSLNTFVTELNPTGSALVYSTLLGSPASSAKPGDSYAAGLALDNLGNAYVTGTTDANDFPTTPGAFQTTNGANLYFTAAGSFVGNPFVTKLNPTGSALVYSTYLGGSGIYQGANFEVGDSAQAIALDSNGSAYVAGTVVSYDFPLQGGLQQTWDGASSGFLAKLNPAGSALDYSTRIAGDSSTVAAVAVNSAGEAYVLGLANPSYFEISPDGSSLAKQRSDQNAIFLARVNASGTALQYATLFGGTGMDTPSALAIGPNGEAIFTGSTRPPDLKTPDFPVTSGAFQTVDKGLARYSPQAFVSEIDLADATQDHFYTTISFNPYQATINQGTPYSLHAIVTSPSGQQATGNVVFSAAPTSSAPFSATSVPLDANGVATLTTSTLAPGSYTLFATYAGDSSHLAVNSLVQPTGVASVLVVGAPAKIVWLYSFNGVSYGESPTGWIVAARVTDLLGSPVANVPVTFSGGNLLFNQATVSTDSNGLANGIVTPLKAGTFDMYARTPGVANPAISVVTINPAPLTVTLQGRQRTYGAPNPAFTYSVQGLIGTDTITVTPQTTATLTSFPGTYPITATVSGPLASDYAVTVNPGQLIINKARLTLQPATVPVTYGSPLPPLSAFNATGFQNGDSIASALSGAPAITTTATAISPVGVYPLNIAQGTLASPQYTFVFLPGTLQVYKARLTLHPTSFTIHVGDALPAFTYSISGFANADTQATALTGAPILTTTAPSTAKPGRYYIVATQGTLTGPNYVVNAPSAATNGILTILR